MEYKDFQFLPDRVEPMQSCISPVYISGQVIKSKSLFLFFIHSLYKFQNVSYCVCNNFGADELIILNTIFVKIEISDPKLIYHLI